ncbi:MAG: GNAT family N-acetyltransferase [Acutalibacteraceae bacterium]
MEKKKLDRKTLKYYARMAAESYVDDPVHVYATKNEKLRKKFLYHFMLERFSSSSGVDYIYEDEEKRGLCIFRDAHNDYTVLDFMKCPNWVFLCVYYISTIKTLKAFSHLDTSVFEKGTYLIEPVFVGKEYQGQGIATKLIKQGISDLTAKGYKIGLETQNPDNVPFYEKLGFKTKEYKFFKAEKIHNYYMVYEGEQQNDD